MTEVLENEDTSSSMNKTEETYATVVLQALSVLKVIKHDFLENEPFQNKQMTLTNNYKAILYGLYNLPNNMLYQELMKTYTCYSQNLTEILVLKPFNFLKNFLDFLNNENNTIEDPNYFQLFNQEKKN